LTLRSGARTALVQRASRVILFLFSAYVAGATPSRAGDFAVPDIIGYSEDLRYFAFEEFGIADASGFPYSNIFVIDLKANSPVPGTTVRIFLEQEDDPESGQLAQARKNAFKAAQPQLNRLNIGWPAEMLAYNADGVPEANRLSLRFGTTGYNGAVIGDYELELIMFPLEAVFECEQWIEGKPQGFTLKITDYELNLKEIDPGTNHYNTQNCPLRYELAGVFAPFEAQDISDAIALISAFSPGYEGPDRRFMVVSLADARELEN
jgi:predicted secreted protein